MAMIGARPAPAACTLLLALAGQQIEQAEIDLPMPGSKQDSQITLATRQQSIHHRRNQKESAPRWNPEYLGAISQRSWSQ